MAFLKDGTVIMRQYHVKMSLKQASFFSPYFPGTRVISAYTLEQTPVSFSLGLRES